MANHLYVETLESGNVILRGDIQLVLGNRRAFRMLKDNSSFEVKDNCVVFDADEDFPEDIIVVVGLEDIWLKIQASPLRCEIKNDEQRFTFLHESNIYNNQNRFFKTYIEENNIKIMSNVFFR